MSEKDNNLNPPPPICLTGIKPTGLVHWGNYFGAILPALQLSKKHPAFYFIADYHALNTINDPQMLKQQIYTIAASWLACGLDTEEDKITFYRQSAIPQIFELSTILMSFTAKGRLNGAHAYKSLVQDNLAQQRDADKKINMGVFTYPVLMTADILMFRATQIPIGKDQVQHLEIANDIGEHFNRTYQCEYFPKITPIFAKQFAHQEEQIVVGLDGRKMSKSYNNTIPLFLPPKNLRKLIMKIVTNSQGIEEKKDADSCNVFNLYRLFSNHEEQEKLRQLYLAGGMGWGKAKQILYEKISEMVKNKREKYEYYLNTPETIDHLLAKGEEQARKIAQQNLKEIKEIVGLG